MQTDKKVILGEITQIPLWSFEFTVKDRRTGEEYGGYTVEAGNEEYDLAIAEDAIRQRYGRLGYEVTGCEYKAERIYTFEAIKEFDTAEESKGDRVPEHLDAEPRTYEMTGQYSDEIAAAMAELDD